MHRPVLAVSAIVLASVAGVAAFHGATPANATVANAEGGYQIDTVHSSVLFSVKHNGVANFYGRFNKVEGSFNIDPADAGKSSIDITVATESVDTANPGRDKHLKSGDFFSAAEFPAITFKSKSFKKTGESTYEVTGDFTLRGKTTPLTVTVTDTGRGKSFKGTEVAGFETKFTVKRSDYGVSYMVGPALADEVTIVVSGEGGK